MKMQIRKKFWVKLLSGLSVAAAVTIPAITLVSCSDNTTNNDNNNGSGDGSNGSNDQTPAKPAPDTSKITTFAQAREFAIDFLKKNYTLNMFKQDMERTVMNNFNSSEKMFKINSWKENDQLVLSYKLSKSKNNNQGQLEKDETILNVQNSQFSVFLVLYNKLLYTCVVSSNSFTRSSENMFQSFDELKSANPNWHEKTIGNGQIIRSIDGSIIQNTNLWDIIDFDNTYSQYILSANESQYIRYGNNFHAYTYSLPIIFANIQDIEENLAPTRP